AELTGKSPLGYAIDCADEKEVLSVFRNHPDIAGVIHFAAYKAVGESVQKPAMYYQNNIGSLCAVLNAMKETGISNLVFSSSCTVYGQPEKAEVTEETLIQKANSPYGDTKIICERIIESVLASGQNIKGALLRYFNPIGAHPSSKLGELPNGIPNNLVPYITQTAAGIREQLVVNGNDYNTPDGTNIRDYIHVVDLAKAHVKAIAWLEKQTQNCCEAFNLGTGKGSSVLEIIHNFEKVNGVKLNYKIGPRRAGDVEQIFANPSKAEKVLGWKCEYSVAEALKHSWNWEKTL
ncbi:MAG: UDP-glucose 4-epimerase GalE, partial [Crocinitomicaceae bacterium]|nr:UDP-glucose 4-epimerase GalE [Crocinitomicaceae bacterium]